jgi:transcription initiation factor TFIID subunit 6
VEGVQPLIPENPPAIPRETDPDATKSELHVNGSVPLPNAATRQQQAQQQ